MREEDPPSCCVLPARRAEGLRRGCLGLVPRDGVRAVEHPVLLLGPLEPHSLRVVVTTGGERRNERADGGTGGGADQGAVAGELTAGGVMGGGAVLAEVLTHAVADASAKAGTDRRSTERPTQPLGHVGAIERVELGVQLQVQAPGVGDALLRELRFLEQGLGGRIRTPVVHLQLVGTATRHGHAELASAAGPARDERPRAVFELDDTVVQTERLARRLTAGVDVDLAGHALLDQVRGVDRHQLILVHARDHLGAAVLQLRLDLAKPGVELGVLAAKRRLEEPELLGELLEVGPGHLAPELELELLHALQERLLDAQGALEGLRLLLLGDATVPLHDLPGRTGGGLRECADRGQGGHDEEGQGDHGTHRVLLLMLFRTRMCGPS